MTPPGTQFTTVFTSCGNIIRQPMNSPPQLPFKSCILTMYKIFPMIRCTNFYVYDYLQCQKNQSNKNRMYIYIDLHNHILPPIKFTNMFYDVLMLLFKYSLFVNLRQVNISCLLHHCVNTMQIVC